MRISYVACCNRAKEAEVAALAEAASHSSRGEQEAQKAAAKAQAASQRLEADIQRLQRHITQLEQSYRQASSSPAQGFARCSLCHAANNVNLLKVSSQAVMCLMQPKMCSLVGHVSGGVPKLCSSKSCVRCNYMWYVQVQLRG